MPVPLMRGHLPCRDNFAWIQKCPLKAGTTVTESWANKDMSDAELGLTGYIMCRRDRIGRRGGAVISYIKESIQAYKIKLLREANCDEAEADEAAI